MAGNSTELRATMADIEADPRSRDQSYVVRNTGCGTAYCFAGHTLKRHGYEPDYSLGADRAERNWIRPSDGEVVPAIDEAVVILGLPEDPEIENALFFRCEIDTPEKMREVVEAVIADDRAVIEVYL